MENFCEAYHLPFIHPGLNEISKLEDHENVLSDGPWSGQLTRAFNASYDEDGRNFTFFSNLSKKWDTEAEYIAFYPNVQIGVHKDHTFAIVIEPKSPGETDEHIEIYYSDPAMRDEEWDGMRKTNASMWKTIFPGRRRRDTGYVSRSSGFRL